ncbi:MAG: hypothetical protein EOO12_09270 [Chitinophagaceae bacterium]|nr:MAG: hypothetical protein EOO12_09270 [Chitinophagaceae bacterium]
MSEWISDIYCYCNQWCERCPLTARCAVFAGTAALGATEHEPDSEGFWKELMEGFYAAHPDFPRDAVEGLTLRPVTEEELLKARHMQEALDARLDEEAAWAAFAAYRDRLYALLEDTDYWRGRARASAEHAALGLCDPQELMREAGRVTGYLHALRRLSDVGEDRLRTAFGLLLRPEEERGLRPAGLVKVALLGLQEARNPLADLYRVFPDEDRILPLFAALGAAERALKGRFPEALDFVRPGFDEAPKPAEQTLPV